MRLVRHRTALVRARTRLAGRIHSQLHQQRLSLPREQQALVATHLELIDRLTPLIRALERRIAASAAGHPSAALLATIPRIGPYRSLLLAAELLPIARFPRASWRGSSTSCCAAASRGAASR